MIFLALASRASLFSISYLNNSTFIFRMASRKKRDPPVEIEDATLQPTSSKQHKVNGTKSSSDSKG
jgi:hypothetical protein